MSTENKTAASVFESADRVSLRLIEQIADVEHRDPRDLPPLGQAIDLEALDTLIESGSSTLTVTFTVHGYDVIVTGNGSVVLDSAPARGVSSE